MCSWPAHSPFNKYEKIGVWWKKSVLAEVTDELYAHPHIAAPRSQYIIGDDTPFERLLFVQRQQELIQQQTSELKANDSEQQQKIQEQQNKIQQQLSKHWDSDRILPTKKKGENRRLNASNLREDNSHKYVIPHSKTTSNYFICVIIL